MGQDNIIQRLPGNGLGNNLGDLTSISAILIDCDGTIYPHVELAHQTAACRTLAQAMNELGLTSDLNTIHEVWHDALGGGIRNFFKTYLDIHQAKFGEDAASLITPAALEEKYEAAYIDFATSAQKPDASDEQKHFFKVRKGLTELFDWAHNLGIPVIAVSNATQRILETSLSASNLKFTDIIGSDTVRAAGYGVKPEPGPYLYTIKKHNIDPTNAIGLEDTLSGIQSLHRAGIARIIRCQNAAIEPREDLGIATDCIKVALTVNPECHLFQKLTPPAIPVKPQSAPVNAGPA